MRPRVTAVGLVMPPDPAAGFAYPDHIDRASLDALPRKPGVYTFRDPDGMPLYIGKSVDLRARVLSHLRNPEEAAMLRATRSVDFSRTAGEVGALLLESQLIKQWQPPCNAQLKTVRATFSLAWEEGMARPLVTASDDGAEAPGAQRYGLYASHGAAEEGLRKLVRGHRLCPAMLGLETRVHGRACFAHQIGHCAGACAGRETRAAHDARLHLALRRLQETVWPYPGPVGIVERDGRLRQVHVVDRWSYLGSLEGRRRRLERPVCPQVDIDTFKILARPLLEGGLETGPCVVGQDAIYWDWRQAG